MAVASPCRRRPGVGRDGDSLRRVSLRPALPPRLRELGTRRSPKVVTPPVTRGTDACPIGLGTDREEAFDMAVLEVACSSGGETVRGDLYLPAGEGPFPAVVMAGGWCYVKELRQPQYAREFVERGFAALIFDYRRLGASDGEPRQHLDPSDQIEDYHNRITYLEPRPGIRAR